MIHVWQIRKPEFPEAREAVAQIAQFVRALAERFSQSGIPSRSYRLKIWNSRGLLGC
jgi:hypothetical protein